MGCYFSNTVSPYQTILRLPITNFLETYSIDFAGTLSLTKSGMKHILVAVEHPTGWPLAKATIDTKSEKVIIFLNEDMIYQFGLPDRVSSDNGSCFSSMKLKTFSSNIGVKWVYT